MHPQRRNIKTRDFTHPFIHKSTLLITWKSDCLKRLKLIQPRLIHNSLLNSSYPVSWASRLSVNTHLLWVVRGGSAVMHNPYFSFLVSPIVIGQMSLAFTRHILLFPFKKWYSSRDTHERWVHVNARCTQGYTHILGAVYLVLPMTST